MANERQPSDMFTGQYVSGVQTGEAEQASRPAAQTREFAQEVAAQYNHQAKPERIVIRVRLITG